MDKLLSMNMIHTGQSYLSGRPGGFAQYLAKKLYGWSMLVLLQYQDYVPNQLLIWCWLCQTLPMKSLTFQLWRQLVIHYGSGSLNGLNTVYSRDLILISISM